MAFKDLREYLAELERRHDLLVIEEPTDVKYVPAAYARKTSDINGPAILFKNMKGYDIPVLAGLYSTKERVALAMGCEPGDLLKNYMEKESRTLEPVLVDAKDAPVQEVVLTGDQIDLRKLPIILNYEKDCGSYITGGVQMAKDPITGKKNASMHRMLYMDPTHLSVFAPPGRQLGTIIARHEDLGVGTEIATVIGCDPIIPIASQCRAPYGTDEMWIAGGMRGAPVEMVKCKTIDLEVPATAEIVIEGRTIPGKRVDDGPFGEYPGTYSAMKPAPVLEVTAITMRHDAIYQNVLTGMPMTENHWMMDLAATAMAYREAYKICPDLVDIRMTPGGTSRHHLIVSIKKRHQFEPRNLIMTLLSANIGIKAVVVVDDDIDINDMLQVEWAINTRCQPEQDVMIFPTIYSPTLDPSAPAARASSKMGIDATAPLGELHGAYTRVYTPGQDAPEVEETLRRYMDEA